MRLPRKLMTIRKSESHFVINLSGNDLHEGHVYVNPLILYPFIRFTLKDSIELLLRIVFNYGQNYYNADTVIGFDKL